MSLPNLRFVPEQASSTAAPVDDLFLFLTLLTAVIGFSIAAGIVYFSLRYRRRPGNLKPKPGGGNLLLELGWTVIPTVISLFIFYWGARVYFTLATPPADAMEVYVVGKQWMWKFQHPAGPMEIDELHVPIGRDIKLTLTTEDVIHSFFVPAFRIKTDVVPGRYRTLWFRATRPGSYHLFCAEYCGTNHSGMRGVVVAMEPTAYQDWLSLGKTTGSIAAEGEKLFQQLACTSCHRSDLQGSGPVLEGLFGKRVALRDGRSVLADESYLRESILAPESQVVAGFEPIMPNFRGLLSEEQVLKLVVYIKSLENHPPDVGNPPRPAYVSPAIESER